MRLAPFLVCLLVAAHAAAAQTIRGHDGGRNLLQSQAVEPAQMIIVPAPVVPVNCVSFSEAAMKAGSGLLCASQFIAHNVTKIICQEFKPECKQQVTEWTLLDPAAPGAPADGYAQTATAACQVMGYTSFGTGSSHMVGAAKETCWNGKAWSSDNWWNTLVCCK